MTKDELITARIEDKISQCRDGYYVTSTGLLDTHEQALAIAASRHAAGVRTFMYGGYDEAERRMLVCVPRDLRKTRFDVCISHCCMAFELVYPESRKIVREQGCLSRLITGRDADGKPLYSAKERGQMSIVRKEIEAAWGESLETK